MYSICGRPWINLGGGLNTKLVVSHLAPGHLDLVFSEMAPDFVRLGWYNWQLTAAAQSSYTLNINQWNLQQRRDTTATLIGTEAVLISTLQK